MKKHSPLRWAVTCTVLWAGGLNWAASPEGDHPPASAPASAPADDPELTHWKEIAQKLGSDKFKDREAAQKELDDTTYHQRDMLSRLADNVTDEEAKARILARVEWIDEQFAIDPPPISVELKNASLTEVCSALSKATGAKIDPYPPNNIVRNGQTFTLSAKEMPFWEVFHALNQQSGISLQSIEGFRLMQQQPGLTTYVRAGGIAIFPLSITRTASVNLQGAGGQVPPERMELRFMVALDPRMPVAQFSPPTLIHVEDDQGNVLLDQTNRPQVRLGGIMRTEGMIDAQVTLTVPPNRGKRIVSAKGEAHFSIQLAQEKLVVTDMEKKLGQPMTVGGQTVTMTQFELVGNSIRFNAQRTQTLFQQAGQPNGVATPPIVRMAFVDATGRQIWTNNLQGGSSGSVGANQVTPPLRVEFSVPTKTKEMVVPFEMKDLPLP